MLSTADTQAIYIKQRRAFCAAFTARRNCAKPAARISIIDSRHFKDWLAEREKIIISIEDFNV